jgi:hypothetical protein
MSQPTSKELDLLPCPFCGGEASYEDIPLDHDVDEHRWGVGCRAEECIGFQWMMTFARKRDAAAAWNKRPVQDSPLSTGRGQTTHEPLSAPDDMDESGRNGHFENYGYVGTASGFIVRDGTFWVATFRTGAEADQYVDLRNEEQPASAQPPGTEDAGSHPDELVTQRSAPSEIAKRAAQWREYPGSTPIDGHDQRALCWIETGDGMAYIGLRLYCFNAGDPHWSSNGRRNEGETVTYWMPLPEPPASRPTKGGE